MNDNKELMMQEQNTGVANIPNMPLGYDEDDADDLIIPRVKIIQALSPERKEKIADEGDIINSLTKDKLNGKKFVPVFKFNNNIDWIPRDNGGGIACQARDGKTGLVMDTGATKLCKTCGKCEFDNSKKGKEAIPTCTKYINFFGFFEGEHSPIILSFAKTNYAEGKKLYSLAKVTMQNMFNNGYTLIEKEVNKNNNQWYNIDVKAAGATSDEDRQFAYALYQTYKGMITTINVDMNDVIGSDTYEESGNIEVDTTGTEY